MKQKTLEPGKPMDILFHHSYNLDLLNLLNIFNEDSDYRFLYPRVYAEFGQPLSQDSKEILKQLTLALEIPLISAPIAFALSIIPHFDKAPLLDLLLDQEGFKAAIEENEPRLIPQIKQLLFLFEVVAPVIKEFENLGFREFWLNEFQLLIEERVDSIELFLQQSPLNNLLHELVDSTYLPEETHIYICALNGSIGVRLTGHSSIVDLSFTDQKIFEFGLKEFFQLSISKLSMKQILQPLAADTFLKLAYEKSQPVTGFEQIESYIQDNIAEAYKVYLLYKSGLMPDPFQFLQTYKQGAYILSVILLDHLEWERSIGGSIESDLGEWLDKNPVGSMMDLYTQAMERAGKHIGDQ